jgi:hypothetical protein
MKDALYSLDFHTDRKDELGKAILIKNASVHVMSSWKASLNALSESSGFGGTICGGMSSSKSPCLSHPWMQNCHCEPSSESSPFIYSGVSIVSII